MGSMQPIPARSHGSDQVNGDPRSSSRIAAESPSIARLSSAPHPCSGSGQGIQSCTEALRPIPWGAGRTGTSRALRGGGDTVPPVADVSRVGGAIVEGRVAKKGEARSPGWDLAPQRRGSLVARGAWGINSSRSTSKARGMPPHIFSSWARSPPGPRRSRLKPRKHHQVVRLLTI
jgi:hypothetical protein